MKVRGGGLTVRVPVWGVPERHWASPSSPLQRGHWSTLVTGLWEITCGRAYEARGAESGTKETPAALS